MAGLPYGAAETGPIALSPAFSGRMTGWPGRNGARCLATPMGPMPGPPPPWGDAEGFVQVEGGRHPRRCRRGGTGRPAHHVRAVHVHLPAVGVDDFADLLHVLLEHAMRGGVSEHQAGEVALVILRLGFEIRQLDAAIGIARDRNDFHSRKHKRWRDSFRERWWGSGRHCDGPQTCFRGYARMTSSPANSPCEPELG